MTKEDLEERIRFAEDRIAILEDKLSDNSLSDKKGSEELIKSYNQWCETYCNLTDLLDNYDEIEAEKARQIRNDKIDLGLRIADIGCKVMVPIGGMVMMYTIAKLSYIQDSDMKLCNGRIFPMFKDVLKIATAKI